MRNVSNFGKGEPTAHTFLFDKNHYLSERERWGDRIQKRTNGDGRKIRSLTI
jgi:hypothetical protein